MQLRELKPENEYVLEDEVPGELVEDNTEREAPEEDVYTNPVCEPLDIVGVGRSLERIDGEIID